MLRERQEHILIGCADARDVAQFHSDAVRETREEYLGRGIDARFHAIRVPGAFVTDEVFADVRRIIHEAQADDGTPRIPFSVFVHIQSHGVVEGAPESKMRAYELTIADEPSLNCGMLNATKVGVQIETLLLERQPELSLRRGEKLRIRTEGDIRTLLREVYGHDGYFAGDWVKSIDDLRTHARGQRSRLERALEADPELRRVDISVTAGLQDYRHHRHLRTDADEVDAPFWDDLHARVHAAAERQQEQARRQSLRQSPLAGLIAMSRVEDSPRDLAAAHYARLNDCDWMSGANTVFTLAGSSYDAPHVPFGAYTITGLYYLLNHLNARDVMVLGRNASQTERMMGKVENDPLMSFILEACGGNLMPINTEELRG